jgi:hypothetical protein
MGGQVKAVSPCDWNIQAVNLGSEGSMNLRCSVSLSYSNCHLLGDSPTYSDLLTIQQEIKLLLPPLPPYIKGGCVVPKQLHWQSTLFGELAWRVSPSWFKWLNPFRVTSFVEGNHVHKATHQDISSLTSMEAMWLCLHLKLGASTCCKSLFPGKAGLAGWKLPMVQLCPSKQLQQEKPERATQH